MNKSNVEEFRLKHRSRNIGLLSNSDHDKIADTTILIAGCGVGSQIALSATRIGFEKFILVDGDRVEISNINRQGFSWRDEGRYKVDALARKIKSINPHARIKKYPIFLDITNTRELAKKANIIVDAIDPIAAIEIVALHRFARQSKIPVIIPLDVGWGAGIYVFNSSSISYEKLLGMDETCDINNLDYKLVLDKFINHYMEISPPYVKKILNSVIKSDIEHYPQPVTATGILSSITVIAMKKIALNQQIKLAPHFIHFDPEINSI